MCRKTVQFYWLKSVYFILPFTSDAAVVLVLDTSGSMGTNDAGNGQTRLAAAKAAAINFLETYATVTNSSAKRYVSIVTFGDNAAAQGITGGNYWVNVARVGSASDTDLSNAESLINRLTSDGGTNTEGGFQLAYNLLIRHEFTSLGISNKYVVFLSDGEPTYHLNGTTNSTTVMQFTGHRGGGDNAQPSDYQDLKNIADSITSTSGGNAAMYSVLYGDAANTHLANGYSRYYPYNPYYISETVMDLFNTFNKRPSTGNILTASSASTLATIFQNILNQQQQTGSTLSSVTDAMVDTGVSTDDQVVDFVAFTTPNGATQSNGSIAWNFANATEDTSGVTSGFHAYYMSYQVKLNNTAASFEDNTPYSLAPATLTYTQLSNSQPHSVSSQTPQVKGYLGSLTLNKAAYQNQSLMLSGAPFALTNLANPALNTNAGSISRATVSGTGAVGDAALGQVQFDGNIPSGFAYTLAETGSFTDTATGKVYEAANTTWIVTVAYGEATVQDQTGATVSNGHDDFTVTDHLRQTYKDITITKTWHKPAEMGTAPITVYLWQDNVEATPTGSSFATLTLDGSSANVSCGDAGVTAAYVGASSNPNLWIYTVRVPDNIPDTGSEHTYKVTEAAVSGFSPAYGGGGLTITNTASGTRSVYVQKDWVVPNDSYKIPVTVNLLQNNSVYGEALTLNSGNSWADHWADLPTYNPADGQYYHYTVQETTPNGYRITGTITGDGSGSTPYVITNTVDDQTTSSTVTKVWNDNSRTNTERPNVQVQLYQDDTAYGQPVTLTSADVSAENTNTWTYTFNDLPRFKFTYNGGKVTAVSEYTYTAQEVSAPDGYTSSHSGLSITNTRAGTVDLTVNKAWSDDFSSHPDVEITLYQNGSPLNLAGQTNPVSINDSYTWNALPEFNGNGVQYHYTIAETSGPNGYTASYSQDDQGFDADGQATVTNTLNTDDTTTTITVNKAWQQPSGITHPAVTFTLSQTASETTNDNYDSWTMPAGTELTGSHPFTAPKYYYTQDQDGNAVENTYTYSVGESFVSGYSSAEPEISQDGLTYNFTNTITGSVDIAVDKDWKDLSGTDHSDMGAVITLYRYTQDVADKTAVGTSWTVGSGADHTWTEDQYDSTGHLYTYVVVETSVPSGYSSSVSANSGSNGNFAYTVTNTLEQSNTGFTVTKYWVDGGRADDSRPDITLELKQGDSSYGSVTVSGNGSLSNLSGELNTSNVSATIGTDNTWTVAFSALPKYNDQRSAVYNYSVSESDVSGYDKTVSNSTGSASITNTLQQDSTSVTIHKIWVDPVGMDHPDATFTLTAAAGGETVTSVGGTAIPTGVTLGFVDSAVVPTDGDGTALTASSADDWYYTFANLPKYDDSRNTITYSVSEGTVQGYSGEPVNGQPYTFCNTIEQAAVTLTGNKIWDQSTPGYLLDSEKPEAVSSIYVQLYRDGQPANIEGVTNPIEVTAGTENNWAFSFSNLDKYDLTDGHAYVYAVYEVEATTAGGSTTYTKVENNGHIHYGTNGKDSYTVSYAVDANDTQITNTFDMPQNYYYQIVRNYTTTLSGSTIYSAQESSIQTAVQAGTVSVDPADYASYNGVGFDYNSTGSNTSVSLDEMNHLYTITLNYTRTLYTLNVNYNFGGDTAPAGYESYSSPTLGEVDSGGNYADPGSYTGTQGYAISNSSTPSGYSISQVTVKEGDGDPAAVSNDYSGGTFNNSDVTVTYYFNRNTSSATVPDSFTIVKTDGTEPITSSSATFTLYSDAACENAVKTFTTATTGDTAGSVTVSAPGDISSGTYYLKETTAPVGYDKIDNVWQVGVSSNPSSEWNQDHTSYVTTTVYSMAVHAMVDGTANSASALEDGKLIVSNARQGTLQITDIVSGLVGTEAGNDHSYAITVANVNDSNDSYTYTVTVGGNGRAITTGNNGTDVISLPAGSYYVTETPVSIDQHSGPGTTYSASATVDNQTIGTVTIASGEQSTITVTNVYSYDSNSHQVTYNVQKNWSDDSNRDGLRPTSVTVELLDYSGKEIGTQAIETPSSSDTASTSFTFDAYANGYTGPYSVEEVGYTDADGYHAFGDEISAVPGYNTPDYSTDGTTLIVTNTHTPDTVNIGAEKIWASGVRQAVTLNLLANGTPVSTLVLDGTASGIWSGNFDGTLYENANGSEITYSVAEASLGSYWTYTVSEAANDDYNHFFQVTNRYSEPDDGGDDTPTIPDNPTPLSPSPETPSTPEIPVTEIPETETPTAEIPDTETPKAEAPATGDNSAVWVLAAATSSIGLVWLVITGFKRKKDEDR